MVGSETFAIVLALVVTARLGWIPSIGYNGFAYTILPAIVIAVQDVPREQTGSYGIVATRDFSGRFGSRAYAVEELVAEMCAAFCSAALGIVPTVRHADYIGAWLEVLREDNRAIVRAASQASKAADWLLGHLPEAQDGDVDAAATDHEVAA